ncbi:MAG: HNH endonuclease signature motif containing protein, partial [bacterium]
MAILLKRQISDDEKKRIIEKFGRICYATGHPINDEDTVQFDHIKAFASGGASEIDNIAPMCGKHNKQKGQLPLYDFKIKLKIEEFFESKDTLTLKDELEYLKS